MYVKAKKIAFLGLLSAISVCSILLGSIFEWNTLVFLALAAFTVGIAIREYGLRYGLGFYIATLLLGLILSPNKLYCATFAAFGVYILITEYVWEKLANSEKCNKRTLIFWVIKYIIFNVIYIPVVILFPVLIYAGKINFIFYAVVILAGQIGLFVYDRAYCCFQSTIWNKFRNLLNK